MVACGGACGGTSHNGTPPGPVRLAAAATTEGGGGEEASAVLSSEATAAPASASTCCSTTRSQPSAVHLACWSLGSDPQLMCGTTPWFLPMATHSAPDGGGGDAAVAARLS